MKSIISDEITLLDVFNSDDDSIIYIIIDVTEDWGELEIDALYGNREEVLEHFKTIYNNVIVSGPEEDIINVIYNEMTSNDETEGYIPKIFVATYNVI